MKAGLGRCTQNGQTSFETANRILALESFHGSWYSLTVI